MTRSGKDALTVNDLTVTYGHGRARVRAIDGISLTVPQGGTLGVVGESGSGKSTLARAIVGMAPVSSGQIVVGGVDLAARRRLPRRDRARRVQMIFQDPYSSLNPAMRIGETLAEALALHSPVGGGERQAAVRELLDLVHLEAHVARQFPRELSGGMRQRVAIARALAVRPQLIIADEVTSALDASVQGVILNLLRELQRTLNLSMLFISHNLAAVRYMSPELVVMRRGVIVEEGATEAVIGRPRHDYTAELLASVPRIDRAGADVFGSHL